MVEIMSNSIQNTMMITCKEKRVKINSNSPQTFDLGYTSGVKEGGLDNSWRDLGDDFQISQEQV